MKAQKASIAAALPPDTAAALGLGSSDEARLAGSMDLTAGEANDMQLPAATTVAKAGPVLVQLSEGESSTSEETAESTGEAPSVPQAAAREATEEEAVPVRVEDR
eukprot:g27383.t1